jgi:hypothetical protein
VLAQTIKEVGRTVRAALRDWPTTERLCCLMGVACIALWIYYHR